jgi:type I restriction enzyme, S subunit
MIDRITLQEVAKIVQGGRHGLSGNQFVTTGFPAYGAGGLNGYLPNFEFNRDAVILSSIGARCGKCFFARGKWSSLANTQVILPEGKIADAKFLWFQLNDERRWPRSGTGQPFIRPSDVKEHIVILPPLSEQKRIAALLEKADRLRRTRHYARQLSDTFLQSVFVEMFGDLRINPRRFEMQLLGDVCDVRDGTHDSPKYHAEGIPLVTSKNLVKGEVDLTKVDLISQRDFETISKRSKVDRGDILMPMIGTIGNPVLVEHEPNYAIKNVALIKFIQSSPDRIFIRETLRGSYFRFIIARNSRGGTQQFISLGDIRSFPIPIPDPALQQKFADIVRRFERLRAQQREAERQAEHLFQTLLHRAFKAEG